MTAGPRAIVGFLAGALIVVSACSNDAQPATTTAPAITIPSVPFEISLVAVDDGGRIKITGTTNLPEGTEVRLSMSRAQILVDENEIRANFVGQRRFQVAGTEFSEVLTPNYRELLAGLDAIWAIDQLARDITVCAEVETGTDRDGAPRQPSADVRGLIGVNGEAFANSPQVKVFGSLTPTPSNWVEVMTTVRLANETVLNEVNAAQAPIRARLADLEGFCL